MPATCRDASFGELKRSVSAPRRTRTGASQRLRYFGPVDADDRKLMLRGHSQRPTSLSVADVEWVPKSSDQLNHSV